MLLSKCRWWDHTDQTPFQCAQHFSNSSPRHSDSLPSSVLEVLSQYLSSTAIALISIAMIMKKVFLASLIGLGKILYDTFF